MPCKLKGMFPTLGLRGLKAPAKVLSGLTLYCTALNTGAMWGCLQDGALTLMTSRTAPFSKVVSHPSLHCTFSRAGSQTIAVVQ